MIGVGDWPRSREGMVRCICPISAEQPFNVVGCLEGIRTAFSRQGLHDFNLDELVFERNVHAWRNEYTGGYMDIVAVFHPVP